MTYSIYRHYAPKMNKPPSKNPIEKYFKVISRYHYYFFFLLFSSKIPIFWHVLNLIFLSPPMDYVCKDNNEVNYCPCDHVEWNRSVFTETIHTKFGIYCESTWLNSFSQSMLFVGTLLGSLAFGFLSDRYGRLTMFCFGCLILAVSGCLVSVMPTIAAFTFMHCFEGFGLGGAIVTSYVLCVEYCSVNNREIITAIYHIPINLSHITLAAVSYFLRHCDHFQLATSLPVFLYVPMYWIAHESPKWLMDVQKVDKAATVMEKIIRFNKQSNDTIRTEIEKYQSTKLKTAHLKLKFWQIFRHKKLTTNLVCMSIIYFVCGTGYYGVSQYIGMMSGDIHVNIAISGALLLPGTIASIFLLKYFGRRPFLMATNFLSGIFMIIVVCIPSHMPWLRVVIACICNSFFFMSFIIVFLYGVELFPTSVRNSVLGILCVLSRVGQIVAPLVNTTSPIASGIIFGVMAIIAGFTCLPLPETKDSELPSSIEDSKTLPRHSMGGRSQIVTMDESDQ